MTTQEIANRLVELCRQGDYNTCYDELFHVDVTTIGPAGSQEGTQTTGIDALKAKGEQFNAMFEEMHSGFTDDAIVAGNVFAVKMGYDATMKGGKRVQEDELVVYTVKEGKIVSEQYFY